jgi:peptide deformylase
MEEGCLSFMDLFLNIERPSSIEVEYQDFKGIIKTAKFAGLTARCYQHELDHLNGIVYTTYLKPLAMQMAMKKRSKLADKKRKLHTQMINKVKEKFNVKRF